MIINNIDYLFLLFILLPLGGMSIYSYFNGAKGLKKLGGLWRYSKLQNIFVVKNFFIYLFFSLFVTFSILALSDIRWDDQLIEDDRDGHEIILVVDISRSMLAEDLPPSRLAYTAKKLLPFLPTIPGARYGLVIFKGAAAAVLPLSDDWNALDLFLNRLTPDLMTVPGTNMAEGLSLAMKQFYQAGKYRSIFLISDGEHKGKAPLAIAKEARKKNIPIITIFAGTEEGGEIYLGENIYLRDENGVPVISRGNPEILKEVARISGGQFYKIDEVEKIKNELLTITKHVESENINQGFKLVKKEKYELFLTLALLFLIISILIRGIRWQNTL